jgi:Tol biopolymer transport system component
MLLAPLLVLFLVPGCNGGDNEVTPSATGRIAFYSDLAGGGRDDIYWVPATGGTATRVTGNERQRNWNPSFSPLGDFIAFQGQDGEQYGEIFRVNPDGSDEVNLTNNARIDDLTPQVNATGTRILFASDRDGDLEIFEMDADDGSNLVQLTENTVPDYMPTYAPNGRIVFISERDGNPEIYIMNANGTGQTRLTNTTESELFPDVSPNGERIAFERFPLGGSSSVYTMRIDGTDVRLFAEDGGHPSYSPDGNWIAYTNGREFLPQPAYGWIIY